MTTATPDLATVLDDVAAANILHVSLRSFRQLVRKGYIHSTVSAAVHPSSPRHPLYYYRNIACYIRDEPVLPLDDGLNYNSRVPVYIAPDSS